MPRTARPAESVLTSAAPVTPPEPQTLFRSAMSATYAPSPWPAPAVAARDPAPSLGREVFLSIDAASPRGLQWRLQRNCSIAPGQLMAAYLLLCAVSLAIGGLFFLQGAPYVLGFAGVELLLVGVALLVFARHASDREVLTLIDRELLVELHLGTRVERAGFSADWLRVEPAAGQGSLVELSGQGQRLRVGRFLRPELRAAFANDLRAAVRRAGATVAPAPIQPDAN